MRMVGLALLIFLLVGVSIGVTQLNIWQRTVSYFFGTNDDLIFEAEAEQTGDDPRFSFVRTRPEGVILLSGTNASQSARFSMPQDGNVASGELEVFATTQVRDDISGLVRIFVGSERRGEILLKPGQRDFSSEIELTAEDLALDELVVRYALAGEELTGNCTFSSGASAVIEIEQRSRLVLDMEGDFLSTRDRIASWGDEVLIGWPRWLAADRQLQRLAAATRLSVNGYDVRFVDAPDTETLSGNALLSLAASEDLPLNDRSIDQVWPAYLAEAGANAGMRSFYQSTAWRHWYSLGPFDYQTRPTAFNYSMMLGPLPPGAKWTITITHNGSIIDVREAVGETHMIEGSVSLERVPFSPTNLIEVIATSDYQPTGLCNQGPEIFAELRPDTHIAGGGEPLPQHLQEVMQLLGQVETVPVRLPRDISLVQAQRFTDIMGALLPQGTSLEPAEANAMILGVTRPDFPRLASELPPGAYVVWLDPSLRLTGASVAEIAVDPDRAPQGTLALVVSPLSNTLQSSLRP